MLGDPPWETRGSSLHIRHLSPGVQHQEDKPLGWIEKTSGVYQKAVKNQGSVLEECIQRFAYFWSHHKGNRLKSA